MTTEEKEAFILRLKEYDKMRFCLVIILYYQKNINGITDLTQITSRNLLVNLPSGIRKVIALYHFDERIGVMEAGQLEKLLNFIEKFLKFTLAKIGQMKELKLQLYFKHIKKNYLHFLVI